MTQPQGAARLRSRGARSALRFGRRRSRIANGDARIEQTLAEVSRTTARLERRLRALQHTANERTALMHSHILITTTSNPLARVQGRDWELLVCGERWFGPDTLAACLEAKRTIEPIANAVEEAQT